MSSPIETRDERIAADVLLNALETHEFLRRYPPSAIGMKVHGLRKVWRALPAGEFSKLPADLYRALLELCGEP